MKNIAFEIRSAGPEDYEEMGEVFRQSIRENASRDYDSQQIAARTGLPQLFYAQKYRLTLDDSHADITLIPVPIDAQQHRGTSCLDFPVDPRLHLVGCSHVRLRDLDEDVAGTQFIAGRAVNIHLDNQYALDIVLDTMARP